MSACGTRTRDLRIPKFDALTTELTPPEWNFLQPAEAYATAAPRAPDGCWNPYRNEPEKEAPHWRLIGAPIPAGFEARGAADGCDRDAEDEGLEQADVDFLGQDRARRGQRRSRCLGGLHG